MFHSCDELFWLYFKSQVLEKKVCSKWMYSVSWSWNFDFPQSNIWKKEIKNERHGCLDFVYVTAINRTVRWLVFFTFSKAFLMKKKWPFHNQDEEHFQFEILSRPCHFKYFWMYCRCTVFWMFGKESNLLGNDYIVNNILLSVSAKAALSFLRLSSFNIE